MSKRWIKLLIIEDDGTQFMVKVDATEEVPETVVERLLELTRINYWRVPEQPDLSDFEDTNSQIEGGDEK
jgi:hypothetical protein